MSSVSRRRGHEWKLAKEKFRRDIRKYFKINVWNSCQDSGGRNTGDFKTRLDPVLHTFELLGRESMRSTLVGGERCWAEWSVLILLC